MTDARLAAAVEAAAREAMRAEGDPSHWRYEQAPEDVAAWWRGWVTPHVSAALAAADAWDREHKPIPQHYSVAGVWTPTEGKRWLTPRPPPDPDEPREPRPVPR